MSKKSNYLSLSAKHSLLAALGFFLGLELMCRMLPIPPSPKFLKEHFGCRVVSGVPPLEMSVINWQVMNGLKFSQSADVLFLGDSSCLMGIVPSYIEARTGLKCWNLGTIGYLGTRGHAAILNLVLKGRKAPRLIVYHFAPYTVSETNETTDFYWNAFKDWIGSDLGNDEFFCSWATERLKSYLASELTRFAEMTWNGKSLYEVKRGPYPSDKDLSEELRKNQGWLAERLPRAEPEQLKAVKLQEFDERCKSGLTQIFSMAEDRGTQVLVQMSPVPDICCTDEVLEKYRQYENKIRSIASQYKNVCLSDCFAESLPSGFFSSYNHLTPIGAGEHSARVGLRLQNLRLAGKQLNF